MQGVMFTLVKRSEVNGGHISRQLKKHLALIIDDAITVQIKPKSVSPLVQDARRAMHLAACWTVPFSSSFSQRKL